MIHPTGLPKFHCNVHSTSVQQVPTVFEFVIAAYGKTCLRNISFNGVGKGSLRQQAWKASVTLNERCAAAAASCWTKIDTVLSRLIHVNTLIRWDDGDCVLMPAVCTRFHQNSTAKHRNCLNGVALMEFTVCVNHCLHYRHRDDTDQGIDSKHTANSLNRSHFLYTISTFALRFYNVLLLIDLLKNRAYSKQKLTVWNAYVTSIFSPQRCWIK